MSRSVSPERLPAKEDSWRMFNSIAPTYDLLNRMLSLGTDRRWRKFVARYLPAAPDQLDLLDLATGTGDQLFALVEARPERFASATGVDPAGEMLALAKRKSFRQPQHLDLSWLAAPVSGLPFHPDAFDVVSISFGIRNIGDFRGALREMHRVLRPGGRVLILEFSLPPNRLLRPVYLFYFRHLLPLIGGWISGRRDAYRYLNRTVEEFPCGADFLREMAGAGYAALGAHPLSCGIATLYWGDKPQPVENLP